VGAGVARRSAGRARPGPTGRIFALVVSIVFGTSGCLGEFGGRTTIESLPDPCGLLGRATVQRLVPEADFQPPRVDKTTRCIWMTPTAGPAAELPEPKELHLATFVTADDDQAHAFLQSDRAKAGAAGGWKPLSGIGDEAFVVSSIKNQFTGRPYAHADVHFRVENVTVLVRYWIEQKTFESASERVPSVRETAATASREVAGNLAARRR
jgi:hypothetical protein